MYAPPPEEPAAAPKSSRLLGVALATLFALVGPAQAQTSDLVGVCAPCHGADGVARDGEVPNLAGQNELYLLNQLRAFHDGRRTHKEMRFMSRNLTEADMEAIAAYFSSLPAR
jgi:cytochrome c553